MQFHQTAKVVDIPLRKVTARIVPKWLPWPTNRRRSFQPLSRTSLKLMRPLVSVGPGEPNGHAGAERLTHSLPGSPADRRPASFEVVGSAESLVGRILAEQGLGKYCDPDFVRYTSKEMQEAMDMTQEEMDRAAHQLLQQEKRVHPVGLGDSLQQPHL